MKTLKLFIILLFISVFANAQKGFNYKALIKDTNGTILTNTSVTFDFSIQKGAALQQVYTEAANLTTDANGIIIYTVGENQANFNTINWSDDDYYLQVKINTGSGLVDMGTTKFRAVPYAINAATANNVSISKIDEGNGFGYRLKSENPANHGNIGLNAVDLSFSNAGGDYGATGQGSTAIGILTTASGIGSTAMGGGTVADSDYATAMGFSTIASGLRSTAMGDSTEASGATSTAMGFSTIASGHYSTAMGIRTKAESYVSTAIGQFNIGGGNPNATQATNKLFEVGNGSSGNNRSNAITVYQGSDATLADNSGILMIGNDSGVNLLFDENEIMARNNGAVSRLYLQRDGGDVAVGGTVVHSSDRRLKQDIETIQYGLKEILNIQPKQYNWKKTPNQTYKSLGVIAQELQTIIPSLVHHDNTKEKMLSVSYTELIPVLIKAIQEQQKIITKQQTQVTNLSTKVENFTTLEARISQLEALLNGNNLSVKGN